MEAVRTWVSLSTEVRIETFSSSLVLLGGEHKGESGRRVAGPANKSPGSYILSLLHHPHHAPVYRQPWTGQEQGTHKQRYERGDLIYSLIIAALMASPPLPNSTPNLYPGLTTHSARGHRRHSYVFMPQWNLISLSLVWNTNLALSVRTLLLF